MHILISSKDALITYKPVVQSVHLIHRYNRGIISLLLDQTLIHVPNYFCS